MEKLLELLSGSDKFKSILLSWFAPILLYVLAFTIVVGPEIKGSWVSTQFSAAARELDLNRGLAVVILCALTALALYIVRDDLYRVLEGYAWPRPLRDWRRERAHIPEAHYVVALRNYIRAINAALDVTAHETALKAADEVRHRRGKPPKGSNPIRRRRPLFVPSDSGLKAQDEEGLPSYVDDDRYIAPTSFGNRMAVVESYAIEAYGLDSQSLWYDLVDLASPNALQSISDARDKLAALVVSFVFSYLYLLAAIGSFIWGAAHNRALLPIGVSALGAWFAALVVYRLALRAVDEYGLTFRTIVNHGRIALADRHGLEIPNTIAREKAMWAALNGTLYYPGDESYNTKLAAFRKQP